MAGTLHILWVDLLFNLFILTTHYQYFTQVQIIVKILGTLTYFFILQKLTTLTRWMQLFTFLIYPCCFLNYTHLSLTLTLIKRGIEPHRKEKTTWLWKLFS